MKTDLNTVWDVVMFFTTLLFGAWLLCGCSAKTHHVDLAGCYATQAGTLAIGSIEVQSAPDGAESAMVSYEDSKAWFSDIKEHRIRILLTGTNSVTAADGIVSNICAAFIATAPTMISSTPARASESKAIPFDGVSYSNSKKDSPGATPETSVPTGTAGEGN